MRWLLPSSTAPILKTRPAYQITPTKTHFQISIFLLIIQWNHIKKELQRTREQERWDFWRIYPQRTRLSLAYEEKGEIFILQKYYYSWNVIRSSQERVLYKRITRNRDRPGDFDREGQANWLQEHREYFLRVFFFKVFFIKFCVMCGLMESPSHHQAIAMLFNDSTSSYLFIFWFFLSFN